jgi:hypothetical protein
MKKIVLLSGFISIAFGNLYSQPTITNQYHSLKAGSDNQMIYTNYADPGQSGADLIWNFGSLPYKQLFTGFLYESAGSEVGLLFTSANIELSEFGSRFFFNVSNSQIEEWGGSTEDGRIQSKYFIPSIKMKYPFSYGQSFSGTFSGNTIVDRVISGDISGDYSVEADAYGTLILPGNHYFENTLRVKSEKNYTSNIGRKEQQVSVTTFRWYDQAHRYPLLVLTEYSILSNNETKVYHQAAFNNNSVTGPKPIVEEGVVLFPNPSASELLMRLDAMEIGTVNIEIYNALGARVRSFQRDASHTGSLQFDLTDEVRGLQPASYIMIIKTGLSIIKKEFTLIK